MYCSRSQLMCQYVLTHSQAKCYWINDAIVQGPENKSKEWNIPQARCDPALTRCLFGSGLCCSSLSVASLGLNDDSTRASNPSPKSLSAANRFSGELPFKMIFTASVKEYWWEAGSPEEVLGWASMAIVVQLASLAFEKHGEMAWPVHGQRQIGVEVQG